MIKIVCVLAGLLAPLGVLAEPINLNQADAETIARELDGVGAARAQAIVDYRKQYGAFESVEDLLNVRGIGEQILEANRDNMTVTAPQK